MANGRLREWSNGPKKASGNAVLVVLALAQLMIVLDATIVTIALPAIRSGLRLSDLEQQWVVNAYTLSFGGLLLLGGRVADALGRRRVLVAGLFCFVLVSACGGVAQNGIWLIAARAVQGASAAVLAPAALSILTTSFTQPAERARAFSVYGAIGAGGAAAGLLLGGVLTDYLNWRWTLFINIPIGLGAALGAVRFIPDLHTRSKAQLDLPGVTTSTLGLICLVYGFVHAGQNGWTSIVTIALLGAGLVLFGVFVGIEARATGPLLPPRILADRSRGGAFLASTVSGAATLALFYFLSLYMQLVRGYSALATGVAFLPNTAVIIVCSPLAGRALLKYGPRWPASSGFVVAAAGLLWLAQLQPHSSYLTTLLPAGGVLCVGLAFILIPLSSTALVGIEPRDAGVAGATFNSTQQIGGSLGLAVLASLAAQTTARAHVGGSTTRLVALTQGYTRALAVAALLMGAGAVITVAVLRSGGPPSHRSSQRTSASARKMTPSSSSVHARSSSGSPPDFKRVNSCSRALSRPADAGSTPPRQSIEIAPRTPL